MEIHNGAHLETGTAETGMLLSCRCDMDGSGLGRCAGTHLGLVAAAQNYLQFTDVTIYAERPCLRVIDTKLDDNGLRRKYETRHLNIVRLCLSQYWALMLQNRPAGIEKADICGMAIYFQPWMELTLTMISEEPERINFQLGTAVSADRIHLEAVWAAERPCSANYFRIQIVLDLNNPGALRDFLQNPHHSSDATAYHARPAQVRKARNVPRIAQSRLLYRSSRALDEPKADMLLQMGHPRARRQPVAVPRLPCVTEGAAERLQSSGPLTHLALKYRRQTDGLCVELVQVLQCLGASVRCVGGEAGGQPVWHRHGRIERHQTAQLLGTARTDTRCYFRADALELLE